MTYEDLEASLTRESRIKDAISRAHHARKNLDPIYYPGEIDKCSEAEIINYVNQCIVFNKKIKSSELGFIRIPKNRKQNRHFFYTPFINYIIKFLLADLIYKNHKVSSKVYGGNKEIFSNPKGDVFRLTGIQFRTWQKRQLKNKSFKWIVIADVYDFYNSVDPLILSKKISEIINVEDDYRYTALIKRHFNSLSIGDWCDHFIQNVYLSNLDIALSKPNWSYGRMTDDIRVFCNSLEEAEEAFSIIEKEISELNLSINTDKLFLLNPDKKLDVRVYRFTEKDKPRSFDEILMQFTHSPYIPIENISDYSTENIWKIIRDSSTLAIDFENVFFEDELPKRITLSAKLDGESGFKFNDLDINIILNEFENPYYKPREEDFEKLKLFIRFGYGNYRFYYRLIHIYFLLLEKSDKAVLTSKINEIFHSRFWSAIDSIHFYYLAKILFLDEKSLLEKLINKYEGFLDLVLIQLCSYAIIGDEGYRKYLWQILTSNYVQLPTLKTNYLNDDFWICQLKKHIETNKYWYHSVNSFLEFLEEKFPDSNLVSFFLAENDYFSTLYEQALEKYEALMYDPQLIEEYQINHRIGTCNEMLGDSENAIKYYDLEIELNKNPDSYNNRAVLSIMSDNYELAKLDLCEAIIINDGFEYFFNLAGLYFLENQYSKSIEYILRAIKASNIDYLHEEAYLHELLALLYIKDKQFEKSIAEAKKYVEYSEDLSFNDYYHKLLKKELDWKFIKTF